MRRKKGSKDIYIYIELIFVLICLRTKIEKKGFNAFFFPSSYFFTNKVVKFFRLSDPINLFKEASHMSSVIGNSDLTTKVTTI